MEILQIFKVGVPYLMVLILPGFIYGSVKGFMVGNRKPETMDLTGALRTVVRSVVINTVTAGLLAWSSVAKRFVDSASSVLATPAASETVLTKSGPNLLGLLVVFMAIPATYGLLAGLIRRSGRSGQGLLSWLLPAKSQPSDQALDQAVFDAAKRGGNVTVIVKTKSKNEEFCGRLGNEGMISQSGGYRDIYLDQLLIDQDGTGVLVPKEGASILIRGSDVRAILFLAEQTQRQEKS